MKECDETVQVSDGGCTVLCPKLGANLLRNGIEIKSVVRSFLFLSCVFETCAQQPPGQQCTYIHSATTMRSVWCHCRFPNKLPHVPPHGSHRHLPKDQTDFRSNGEDKHMTSLINIGIRARLGERILALVIAVKLGLEVRVLRLRNAMGKY